MYRTAVFVLPVVALVAAAGQTALPDAKDFVYRVGGAVSAPKVVNHVDPEYSEEARRAHVNAAIRLDVVVSVDGTVRDATVTRGAGFGLDEKAIAAVSEWQFEPAMKAGEPVAASTTIEVNLRLLDNRRAGQTARLLFTLPEKVLHPVLEAGVIPENPAEPGDQFLRIGFTVGEDGRPTGFRVLETTSEAWAQAALNTLRLWQFTPAMLLGIAVPANGVLRVARGPEPVGK
jgi:TonB family protein